MSKWSRSVCLLLIASMLTGLIAGCGTQAGNDKIKVGLVFELSGNTASFGTSAANGAKLAVKQINAAGGILGKQIDGVIADNRSEAAEAANAMTKVINQDGVVAVTGFTVSSNGIAASTVAEASKIPFVAAATTASEVTVDAKTNKVKDYVFRVCFANPFQGQVAANFAVNSLQAKRAVILIDSSSDYSKGLTLVFKQVYPSLGGTIVGEEAYLQKDQDFKTILTKIKALNPDVIFLPGYYEEVGKIIRQARELGITAPFVGGDGWDSPKLAEIGGADALNNTFFVNHYSVQDQSPKAKQFLEDYQKEYGQQPDAMAVLAYDAMYVLADAIKRANSTQPDPIRAALAATQEFAGVTGNISFNATHDAIKNAVIIEMKDGKMMFKESIKP